MSAVRWLVLGLVILVSAVPPAWSQVLYGSIVGTVEDQTGAVVPRATITITNKATGVTRETTADEAGRYSLVNVLPGGYDLKVTASGFRPLTRSDVMVTINTVTRVDVRLEVGALTEQITVAASSIVLQTDKSDVRAEISTKAITNLPLANYRNYQSLINLVPGATPADFQNAVVDTPGRALRTNINGTNPNNNNTRTDGATNIFIWLPHHTAYVPPVEAIETVNITTGSFDAEQGMAGGAAVTVVTKSGTNEFHGVGFWYHDNQRLRARNFFLRTPGKPKSIFNIPGGTLGGPIKKDKLFFFASYEGTLERSGQSGLYSVPTEKMRRGDFSESTREIYDPATGNPDGTGRVPFPNRIIPSTRLHPISLKIQNSAPLPNLPSADTLNNYANSGTEKLNRHNWDFKVNWNPHSDHAVFGKYSRMDALVNSIFSLGEAGGPGLSRAGVGDGDTTTQLLTFGHTWTMSPTFIIDGTFGYTRFDQAVTGPDHGKNYGSEIWGIPGTNAPIGPGADKVAKCPQPGCYSGMPMIAHGYTTWGNTNGWLPLFRNERSFTYTTNTSKIQGAHELRFGFDLVRHHMDHWQPEISNGPRGYIEFGGNPTALKGGVAPNYFNRYATYLLGLPTFYSKAVQFLLMTNREWQFGWYARDRWQVTRNLTFNLGLRYEYYPLITRKDRGIERWDPATNKVYMGRIGGNPDNVGITVSKKMFAPRVGFAYRLNESTVLRSGYGITYDPLPFARPLRGLYPATIAASFPSLDPYGWYNTLDKGIPPVPLPDISTGVLDLPPTVDMGPRSPYSGQLDRGYIQSWNFTVERKLPADLVTSIAYVGTQTVHQLADRDINAAGPGGGPKGRPLYATQGRAITANMWDGWLSANYHSLQVAINRQFSKGLLLKGAYTWSKAISLTDEDGWASVNRNWGPEIRWNRAPAGYDRTHMFVLGWVYELPFGPGKTWATAGPASALLRGWQTNGVFSSYTGTPFTVTADGTGVNAPGNTQSADQVKSGKVQKIGDVGPGTSFFDPLAFATPVGVRFGHTGRNILRGPGRVNVDFSLFRTFALTERLRMEFKAEAFNFTNTPHFNNPSAYVSNMSLNPDGTLKSLGGFSSITSARADERQFRFGIRFSF